MFKTKSGDEFFVIDGHLHLWDASPENQANKYGAGFISCFYDYHRNLSPPDYVWEQSLFEKYGPERMLKDVFIDGYVDMGIFQPTRSEERRVGKEGRFRMAQETYKEREV